MSISRRRKSQNRAKRVAVRAISSAPLSIEFANGSQGGHTWVWRESTRGRALVTLSPFALLVLGFVALFALCCVPSEAKAVEATNADVSVYRLYNHHDGSHLFTADANEYRVLTKSGDWWDEGIAFLSPTSGIVVHRLYNPSNGDHLYTTDENERTSLIRAGWRDDSSSFNASKEPTAYDVRRLYNPNMRGNGGRGNHLWTIDDNEYNVTSKKGWRPEGHCWYATGRGISKAHPTPLAQHGALAVSGTKLVDRGGTPFQLRGVSTHGLAWFPQYVSKASFQTLRDDWGANCVRLALYPHEYGGYASGGNQNELKTRIRQGVNAARDLGMYVIVDWHVLNENSPTVYESQAREFFGQMSREFASYENVLYEICNEPNGWADWNTVKGYAERIIPVIRSNDPDAVVIVGTPNWSQFVDQAAARPLTGANAKNTMYALHFYAGTHGQWLRDTMTRALDGGLPIFISEFGTCTADGQSGFYESEAKAWIDLANRRGVSWINWSLCNKAEAASAIQSWCNKTSDWQQGELTQSGAWVRSQTRAAAGL